MIVGRAAGALPRFMDGPVTGAPRFTRSTLTRLSQCVALETTATSFLGWWTVDGATANLNMNLQPILHVEWH